MAYITVTGTLSSVHGISVSNPVLTVEIDTSKVSEGFFIARLVAFKDSAKINLSNRGFFLVGTDGSIIHELKIMLTDTEKTSITITQMLEKVRDEVALRLGVTNPAVNIIISI